MGAGEELARATCPFIPMQVKRELFPWERPYAEIPDEDTDTWYRNDYSQDTIPDEFIDEFAEE